MMESSFKVFPDDGRTANQVAYDEKMMFWKDAIRRWCITNRQASFSIGQLQSNFERNGRLPQCLHTVIDHMIEQGAVARLADYYASRPQAAKFADNAATMKSLLQSVKGFIGGSIRLAIRGGVSVTGLIRNAFGMTAAVATTTPDSTVPNDRRTEVMVITDLVQMMAEQIHSENYRTTQTDNLFLYHTLYQSCQRICSDRVSFALALDHLCREKRAVILTDVNGYEVVNLMAYRRLPIEPSSKDLVLLRIKAVKSKMEQEIEGIVIWMQQCESSISQLVRDGNGTSDERKAMRLLKSLKMMKITYQQKETTLDRVSTFIGILERQRLHKELHDVYKDAHQYFCHLKSSGLTEDSTDKTIGQLQEASDDADATGHTLSFSFDGHGGPGDDDDLRLELKEFRSSAVPSQKSTAASHTQPRFSSSNAASTSTREDHLIATGDCNFHSLFSSASFNSPDLATVSSYEQLTAVATPQSRYLQSNSVTAHAQERLDSPSTSYRTMAQLQTDPSVMSSSQPNLSRTSPPSICHPENGNGSTFMGVTSSDSVAASDRSRKCLVTS